MGVGLAATQLGHPAAHARLPGGLGRAGRPSLVNPEIEWRSEDLVTAEEGCLSLPGIVVDVERPLLRQGARRRPGGEPLAVEASGLEARVIQHEVDHLDGVLMLERAPNATSASGALRALREGGTYAPERPDDESAANGGGPAGSGGPRSLPTRAVEDRLPRHLRVRGDGAPAPRRQPRTRRRWSSPRRTAAGAGAASSPATGRGGGPRARSGAPPDAERQRGGVAGGDRAPRTPRRSWSAPSAS